MQYLIALALPETHEQKRQRVLDAAIVHLAADGDVQILSEEVGVRASRRAGTPKQIFRLVRLEAEEPKEVAKAAELVDRAIESGNSMLRSQGLTNVQINVYVQPPIEEG